MNSWLRSLIPFIADIQPEIGYFDVDGRGVVLNDDEWQELLEAVMPDAGDRLSYKTGTISTAAQKSVPRKMHKHLVGLARANKETFHQRYVSRSATGESSKRLLALLLRSYAYKTGLAQIFGDAESSAPNSTIVSPLELFGDIPICITLYGHSPLRLFRRRPVGRVWFEAKSITSVFGSVDNFVLKTEHLSIKFTEERVIISESARIPPVELQESCLRFLDDLTYVIECISTNILGEAKFELGRLIERGTIGEYELADMEKTLEDLRKALERLRSNNASHCASDLARIRKTHWKTLD